MHKIYRIYILFFLFFIAAEIHAEEYQIVKYSSFEHLNGENITTGMQDNQGFIWFTTSRGMYRYNGRKFEKILIPKFDKKKKSLLPNNENADLIVGIFQDSKGVFWIAFQHSLVRYDKRTFKYMDSEFNSTIGHFRHFIESKDGSIWFASNNSLFRYKNEKFQDLSAAAGLSKRSKQSKGAYEYLYGMIADQNNFIRIITTNGIKKFDGSSFKYTEKDTLKFKSSHSFFANNSDTLIVGKSEGILEIHTNDKITTESLGADNPIFSIFKDSRGTCWIGTKIGLYKYSNGHKTFIKTSSDPKPPSVLKIFEDKETNIWVLTTRELYKLRRSDYKKIAIETIASIADPITIAEDQKGRIWIGTNKQGLFIYENGKTKKAQVLLGSDVRSIQYILISKSGYIWLHTNKGLIGIRDKEIYTFFNIDGLNTKVISYPLLDKDDNLYFLDHKKKLRIFDGKKLIQPQLPTKKTILGLLKDQNGEIFLRTENFLSSINGVTKINLSNIPFGKYTFKYLFDQDSGIWAFHLDRGFYYLKRLYGDKIEIVNISQKDGLLDNRIRILFQDKKGFLWIGTENGISRFDAKTYKKTGQTVFENFKNPENEASRNIKKFIQDKSGNIWAATSHGILRFDYAEVNRPLDNYPPPVYVTGLELFLDKFNYLDYCDKIDDVTGLPENLVLPYNKNYITFNYIGLYYTDPDAIEYQYRLLGFDGGWSPIVKMNERTYTNLPPGEYTFEVKARNKDGQWSAKPASFSFTINPPFWKTWWFYMLSIGLAATAVFAYINMKTRNLKKQKMILERTVEERTSELQSEKMKVEAVNQEIKFI